MRCVREICDCVVTIASKSLQVELVGYSDWVNQYRQRLRQLAERILPSGFMASREPGV
jgi:two-component system phosphoglycerate transport system response regulator PgtA